ncbi:enoyl-CoA hydratase-related protein [Tranquillimonas alkanivorans]|uniref:Short chain enoyl-CoA hydratase n=1 Tax=Tranquillimonas alkanivorans TaxID=441119 RepID=A0A1I5VD70_9RHOB|nr:enoyl-CoA hydratase-related protein [Tranquillimonas alkanivorans]SFQ05433.1 short chain enoyl-CoA hydratase [Tranquillimonas alkanivorans]
MSVLFDVRDHVARVTIDRPDRMNAVDAATEAELDRIWDEIEVRDDIRCVVLTGAGDRAFSAGADMKANTGKSGLEYWATGNPNGFGGISLRTSLSIPVIARVNGLALGGGFEMVLGADIVIAAETAKFGLPEAKVGRLPLDGGMVALQRLIPRNIAAGLMMTGRTLSATEAAHYGLVNAVVAPEALDEEVDAWVTDVLSCAPLSVAAIKQTVRQTAHLSPVEARNLQTPALMAALASEDQEEGVQAFREKRTPVWRGR